MTLTRIHPAGLRAIFIAVAAVLMAFAGARATAVANAPASMLAVLDFEPGTNRVDYSLDGWPHHTQGTFTL